MSVAECAVKLPTHTTTTTADNNNHSMCIHQLHTCVCAHFACLPFLSLSWCLCSYYRPLSLSHISTTAFVSAVHVLVVIAIVVVVVDVGSGGGGCAGVGLNSLSSFLLSFRVLQLKFVFSIVIFLRSFVLSFFGCKYCMRALSILTLSLEIRLETTGFEFNAVTVVVVIALVLCQMAIVTKK